MHTKDQLAEALRGAGLLDMADKAAKGYYHDFLSPLALPEIQLMTDLRSAQASSSGEQKVKLEELIARHSKGDFDASSEESEDWAASPDGQLAFNELIKGTKK